MPRYTNPSGYVKYDTEKELCDELEKYFFPTFFDKPWRPINGVYKEVVITPQNKCRVDYFGYIKKIPTWVEIKNWFTKTKDIRQIYKYILRLRETQSYHYNFYLICGGIEKKRESLLYELDVDIILVRDIKELNPKAVVYWM